MDTDLQRLIAEVLGIPPERVQPQLRRDDVVEWDSLNHLRLITALESDLGASFTMEQIVAVATVSDLERAVRPPAGGGAGHQRAR